MVPWNQLLRKTERNMTGQWSTWTSPSAHSAHLNGRNEVKPKGFSFDYWELRTGGYKRLLWHSDKLLKRRCRRIYILEVRSMLMFWWLNKMEVLQSSTRLMIGMLQTAVNACTLALIDAGIPMDDYVCATSVGLVGENAILGIRSSRFWFNFRSQRYWGSRYTKCYGCNSRKHRKDYAHTGTSPIDCDPDLKVWTTLSYAIFRDFAWPCVVWVREGPSNDDTDNPRTE